MNSQLTHPEHTNEQFSLLLKRRSRPCVVIVDADLNVAFADSRAQAVLETHFQLRDLKTLPVVLKDAIAETIRRVPEGQVTSDHLVSFVAGFVLHVIALSGAHGLFYALLFEKDARREDLKEAVNRFLLTPREVEVLDLILEGLSAAEIAEGLNIKEVTVFDHFKHINDKTNARNRADMLAKIFNWQPALKSTALPKNGVDRRLAFRSKGDRLEA